MLIKCPSCSKTNDLNFEADVSCGHCKKTLRGHTYGRVKSSVAAIVIAFGVGAFATNKVGDYTGAADRYSIKNEFAIIEICLNSSQQALALYQYKGKKEDCICALSEVQKMYGVKDLNDKRTEYLAAFDSAARACKASRASLTYSR
jgi:hypothetical protein